MEPNELLNIIAENVDFERQQKVIDAIDAYVNKSNSIAFTDGYNNAIDEMNKKADRNNLSD